MRTKIHYLLLCIITAMVCVPVMAEIEALESAPGPLLIGRPNPAMAGIEKIHVVIVRADSEPNEAGLIWGELEAKVVNKLNKAGIKISPGIAGNILDVEELRIYAEILKLEESKQYVFHVQTSVARKVVLSMKLRRYIKTDVWKTAPVMQAVSIDNMPAKVTDVVLEQIEAFIHAYVAARPMGKKSSGRRANVVVPPKPTIPAGPKHKYIASQKSKVFHLPDCSSAGRIKRTNLVVYNSRQEATSAGKRPCKLCKP